MKVWNYNETAAGREDELLGRGVALANLLIAGEDLVFQTLYEFLELDRASGDATVDFSQSIDMQGRSARYVKLEILANHNGAIFGDEVGPDAFQNFAGLSEVQFFGVPEPSTYALAMVGLSTLLCVRGRRRVA